jgi:murein L,D-transpeptidase YcbB/YkuD
VDTPTLRALNLSVDEEIEAIALSLERWRWMPRDLGRKHLYVNIPDYHVTFRDGSETRLSMVVVVGAVEHQTPSFSRDMTYMEFNPTWTVPASIANQELIPKELRQPGYLASRQFEILKRVDNQLVPVPADQISPDDFRKASFPYVLRQRSGPINALGRMKFLFPNPYAIYLHDTQAKKHFTLNDRAFSHGCIRLSEPDRLATLLMQEDGYEQAEIDRALQTRETIRVRLRSPIPTHLAYMTTWVDTQGSLQRRADIYGHDAALRIALQASETLLSLLRQPSAEIDTSMLLVSDG